MNVRILHLLTLLGFVALVVANTEKVIFVAPERSPGAAPPAPADFRLTDTSRVLAATLNTSFTHPGVEYWVELADLQP